MNDLFGKFEEKIEDLNKRIGQIGTNKQNMKTALVNLQTLIGQINVSHEGERQCKIKLEEYQSQIANLTNQNKILQDEKIKREKEDGDKQNSAKCAEQIRNLQNQIDKNQEKLRELLGKFQESLENFNTDDENITTINNINETLNALIKNQPQGQVQPPNGKQQINHENYDDESKDDSKPVKSYRNYDKITIITANNNSLLKRSLGKWISDKIVSDTNIFNEQGKQVYDYIFKFFSDTLNKKLQIKRNYDPGIAEVKIDDDELVQFKDEYNRETNNKMMKNALNEYFNYVTANDSSEIKGGRRIRHRRKTKKRQRGGYVYPMSKKLDSETMIVFGRKRRGKTKRSKTKSHIRLKTRTKSKSKSKFRPKSKTKRI